MPKGKCIIKMLVNIQIPMNSQCKTEFFLFAYEYKNIWPKDGQPTYFIEERSSYSKLCIHTSYLPHFSLSLNTIYFTSITQKAHRTYKRVLQGADVGILWSNVVEETVERGGNP